ncbi:histidine kinase [Nocardioides sp. Bht2]|uniref:sensor histidine kinase n=1 Tax=Nocardioides sp. Bht2 TaxID=3392297 RepID=UPI0039B52C21
MSTAATVTPGLVPPPRLGQPGALRSRLKLSAWSFVYVLLAVPALVLGVVVLVSLSVAVVGVGLALLLIFVPLLSRFADLHRVTAGHLLGRKIERPYRREVAAPLPMLRAWAAEPGRWRELGWSFMSLSLGWVISWLAFGFALAVVWYLVFPFVYWVSPAGVFEVNYSFIVLDTQAKAFIEWALLLVVIPLWWHGTPLLMRWRVLLDEAMLAPSRADLERRVAEVTESRAESIDHSAAEIRRIERDLHDGAQARLVSLGMSLGLAEQKLRESPEQALELIREAQAGAQGALGDIRGVVRGIHPPVLADRGLGGAVQALALDLDVPTSVLIDLPGRPPAPVESAAYFAINEALANVVKHAGATRAIVEVYHREGRLRIAISDNGRGGADPAGGTGLRGLAKRLAAFDGTMTLESPLGGPTRITMEIPCALSSPRTMPSSGTV